MEQVAVLGAGSWGTALAVHLARVGHDGAPVGARRRARGRHARAPRERACTCPTSRFPTAARRRPASLERSARRAPSSSSRRALARHARRDAARGAARSPRRDGRQRDEGPRGRTPCCGCREVIDEELAPRASRRRAVGPQLRRRGRARAADGGLRRVDRRRRRRARAGGLPRPGTSASTQRRCGRRRDRRRR